MYDIFVVSIVIVEKIYFFYIENRGKSFEYNHIKRCELSATALFGNFINAESIWIQTQETITLLTIACAMNYNKWFFIDLT